MKNPKRSITISAEAVELSHLRPDSQLTVAVGENTLMVVPERMTAIQAVNTIGALTGFTSDLIDAVKAACGSCEDQLEAGGCPYEDCRGPGKCPYEDVDEPEVQLSAAARKALGIPPDAKVEFLPDKGEGLVCAADYEHDITDVPVDIRTLLAASGVCLGRLDEAVIGEKEVWHG